MVLFAGCAFGLFARFTSWKTVLPLVGSPQPVRGRDNTSRAFKHRAVGLGLMYLYTAIASRPTLSTVRRVRGCCGWLMGASVGRLNYPYSRSNRQGAEIEPGNASSGLRLLTKDGVFCRWFLCSCRVNFGPF